jgi:hypothetical protein
MVHWSDGVLECCNKVAGFATITPFLQYSNTLNLIKNQNTMAVKPYFCSYNRNFIHGI